MECIFAVCLAYILTNKADAKPPPLVILTASRRQSFRCPKSTSSRQSVIFFTSQSHFFTWLTLGTIPEPYSTLRSVKCLLFSFARGRHGSAALLSLLVPVNVSNHCFPKVTNNNIYRYNIQYAKYTHIIYTIYKSTISLHNSPGQNW